jgi:poly(A) polymerase
MIKPDIPNSSPSLAPADPEVDPARIDQDALKVIHRLHQRGRQAYLVGGCVRDLLLGRKPKDFDIATSAHPNEVRGIFSNSRLIGRRFRLAHVYFKGGKIIEVSTFRSTPMMEVPEVAAGGPEEVSSQSTNGNGNGADLFITQDNVFGTAEQDARRRDFTINGLFYDVEVGQVIDYVRGRRDLEARLVRTIGDPEVRMREDPVRILRAVRFACKLGFDIESRTYAAMEGAVEDLPRCAPARLLEETFRLLRGGVSACSIRLLSALDALKVLLPPVYEYMRRWGHEHEKTFYAFASALDRRVESLGPPEDAVLLATLLLPITRSTLASQGSGDSPPKLAQAVEDLLRDLTRDARLPRRIAQRCRMILMAQPILSGQRAPRRSPGNFRRFPLFEEALTLFALSVDATGEHKDLLEAWKSGGAPPVPAGGAHTTRRRRRRRPRRDHSSARVKATAAE